MKETTYKFIGGMVCGGVGVIALYYIIVLVKWLVWANVFINANVK